mmetsp:Transcript_9651/g.14885  ORF Transcript_9651/g.14885 Transcript_9651/m.14885 type:complete len:183 (+) Transcript_9651:209-757(+)
MSLDRTTPSFFRNDPFFRGFHDFFPTPMLTDDSGAATPFLTNPEDGGMMAKLRHSSPFFEVTEDDKQFQLAVDVPGMKLEDMDVQLEHGGRVLHLNGARKVRQDLPGGGMTQSESKFEKRFTLDHTVDIHKITANLADGVLVITAPKQEAAPSNVRKIVITEGGGGQPSKMIAEDSPKEEFS